MSPSTYASICESIYIYVYIYAYTYAYACTCTCICACMQINIPINIDKKYMSLSIHHLDCIFHFYTLI